MDLEEQLTPFILATKLKDLGVSQDSQYYWLESVTGERKLLTKHDLKGILPERLYSAYSVAELGNFFPVYFQLPFKTKNGWVWTSSTGRHALETEAAARSRFLVYNLENGNIKL